MKVVTLGEYAKHTLYHELMYEHYGAIPDS